MNEVYLIRMEWWELALFTMFIAMAGAFFYRVLPPVFEKWVNDFEQRVKEHEARRERREGK